MVPSSPFGSSGFHGIILVSYGDMNHLRPCHWKGTEWLRSHGCYSLRTMDF